MAVKGHKEGAIVAIQVGVSYAEAISLNSLNQLLEEALRVGSALAEI